MTFFVKTLAEAHDLAVKRVILDGIHITTENNEETIELPYSFQVIISHPLIYPQTSPGFTKYGPAFLTAYTKKVMDMTPNKNDGSDASYTYGNRLREYTTIDQIETTITKLNKSPRTRRAIMHTWRVAQDI